MKAILLALVIPLVLALGVSLASHPFIRIFNRDVGELEEDWEMARFETYVTVVRDGIDKLFCSKEEQSSAS